MAADLATVELEVVGRLAYSSNATFLVRYRSSGDSQPEASSLAVYKPAAGERPLWDFPAESLFRREVAAYELSRWLGWDLVPQTVVRVDGPLGPGSVQAFVDHDPEQHYFTLLEGRRRVFRRLAFFDMIVNNADRKGGHCLADGGGRVWAIDNGLTFHPDPKLRTVVWDFAGQRLPAAERQAAARLAKALSGATDIVQALGRLLAKEEVAALRARAASLSLPGLYPAPTNSWAFPWPLV